MVAGVGQKSGVNSTTESLKADLETAKEQPRSACIGEKVHGPVTSQKQASEESTTASSSATSDDNASIHPSPDDDPVSTSALQRRNIVLSLCMAQFLAALDITIIATASPTITRTLSASASEYAWVGSSYNLASTATTPIWAKMSDVFGKKTILMTANGVFMGGSVVAARATSPGMLIAGRTFQGIGGGGIQIMVMVIIGSLLKLEDRAKYYGLTAGVFAIAGALEPVLGGVFTERLSWRWCFYLNLPFDAISLVLLFFALKLLHAPRPPVLAGLRSLDWIGSAFIISGTICFLFGLETGAGGKKAWDFAEVLCLLNFGAALLAFFVYFEARFARNPLIPIRVFSTITNMASFALTCLHSFVFVAYDYFIPLYLQIVLNFAPIISGVSMLALVIPLTVSTAGTGFLIKKTGNYIHAVYWGAAFMALGTGLFISFPVSRSWAKIICYLFLAALGAGSLFQTPLIALQAHTEPKDLTAAMSAMTFLRSLFMSMSIVVGSVILQSRIGGRSLSDVGSRNEGAEFKRTYVSALKMLWVFYTCVCAVMVVAAAFVKRTNVKKKAEVVEAVVEEERVDENR